MKCINASTLFLQISNTIDDIDKSVLAGADATMQSYFAKYLAVYITGIYEQSIEEIIWEFASTLGQSEIENFVANQVHATFRNPDMTNINKLIKQFSTTWSTQLMRLDSRPKLAIDSMVANKNLIAHGDASGITLNDVKAFHRDATVVIETVDRLLLGI